MLCHLSVLENKINHDHYRGCKRVPGQRAQVQRAAEKMPFISAVCRFEQVMHTIRVQVKHYSFTYANNKTHLILLQGFQFFD